MKPFFSFLLLTAFIASSSASSCQPEHLMNGDMDLPMHAGQTRNCHKGQGSRMGDMDEIWVNGKPCFTKECRDANMPK